MPRRLISAERVREGRSADDGMSLRIVKTAIAAVSIALAVSLRPRAIGNGGKRSGAGTRPHDERGLRATRSASEPAIPYDPSRVRTAFSRLWSLGLFDDITVDAEDGPQGGKVLVVKVKERPSLASGFVSGQQSPDAHDDRGGLKDKKIVLDVGQAAEPEDRSRTPRARSA